MFHVAFSATLEGKMLNDERPWLVFVFLDVFFKFFSLLRELPKRGELFSTLFVPIWHRCYRLKFNSVGIVGGIAPRAPTVPGKNWNIHGKSLLIGDSLRLMFAQENHGLSLFDSLMELLFSVVAIPNFRKLQALLS